MLKIMGKKIFTILGWIFLFKPMKSLEPDEGRVTYIFFQEHYHVNSFLSVLIWTQNIC